MRTIAKCSLYPRRRSKIGCRGPSERPVRSSEPALARYLREPSPAGLVNREEDMVDTSTQPGEEARPEGGPDGNPGGQPDGAQGKRREGEQVGEREAQEGEPDAQDQAQETGEQAQQEEEEEDD
jgi:hypothetical protein